MRPKLLPLALALMVSPMVAHGEDLLQAYQQARANDPVLAQSKANQQIGQEGVVQARSQLLPQIGASLSLTQSNQNGTSTTGTTSTGSADLGGHTRTRDLSANLSQSVLDLSKYANLKSADASARAQDESYRAAAQALMVRVASAYFNVLTSKDSLKFAKANERSLARQLDQAQQRFKVGLSAITDVQDAKAQHDSAVAQVIQAQNALDDAREALTQITGKPAAGLKVLRDKLPLDPPKPDNQKSWVETALQQNPSVLAQKDSVSAAEHSISAARAGHLPTIDASVGYGKTATWSANGAYHYSTPASTRVGLTLTVPLFSGGYTQSRVRQSIYQRDAAEDSLESQRRQVVRETRNYFRSVISGISQVEATKAAVASSQSALEATQAGFEVGTRTIVDVLFAQRNLLQAQQAYSQARHQFILNQLLLKQSAGTITMDDLRGVNALLQ